MEELHTSPILPPTPQINYLPQVCLKAVEMVMRRESNLQSPGNWPEFTAASFRGLIYLCFYCGHSLPLSLYPYQPSFPQFSCLFRGNVYPLPGRNRVWHIGSMMGNHQKFLFTKISQEGEEFLKRNALRNDKYSSQLFAGRYI